MNIFIPEQFIELLPIISAFLVSLILLLIVIIKQRVKIKNALNIGFIGIISLSTIWSFTYFLRKIENDLSNFIDILYIEYFPHVFIGLAWFFFSLLFIRKGKIIKKYGIFLIIPPVISYVLLLTNHLHYLFFRNVEIGNLENGPLWYFPHLSISYLYIITGIVLLFIYYFKNNIKIERKRTLLVLMGAIVPLMGNIIDTILRNSGILVINIDLTPVFFTFSNVFFAIALIRYKLLVQESAVFRELMKSIRGVVMIFDHNNKLLDINEIGLKLLGKNKNKTFGKDVNDIYENVKCENVSIKEFVIKNKEVINKEIKLIGPHRVYYNLSISIIRNKRNNITNKIIIMSDISEVKEHHQQILKMNLDLKEQSRDLKKSNDDMEKSQIALINLMEDLNNTSEELEKSNKKLSKVDEMRKEFVSHTAHELRTPLNALRWSLEMILNEDVGRINRSQRELLDQIYKSNIRLLGLVEDLLEVSRMDQSQFKVEIKKCELDKLIDRVLGDLSIKIREKNIKLDWKKTKKKLPKIKADCDRMIQVLINVIGNAVKYTKSDDDISIEISEVDYIAPLAVIKEHEVKKCSCINNIGKHKKFLLCKVTDSGIGIPPKDQEKMFSRFFRASNAMSSQEEGTGLGMTITKKIIELHQGMIWFESIEGKGTTFYFTIPIINQ